MLYGDDEYGSLSLADIIAEIIQVISLKNVEVQLVEAFKKNTFISENKQNIFKADDLLRSIETLLFITARKDSIFISENKQNIFKAERF